MILAGIFLVGLGLGFMIGQATRPGAVPRPYLVGFLDGYRMRDREVCAGILKVQHNLNRVADEMDAARRIERRN